MTRLLYLLAPQQGVSRTEFEDHWRHHHIEVHGLPQDRIRRYVAYSPAEVQSSPSSPWIAAVSVWLDHDAALAEVMADAMRAAGPDELLFIDHARSDAMVVDDLVLSEPHHRSRVVAFEAIAASGRGPEELGGAARDWAASVDDELQLGVIVSTPREPGAGTGAFRGLGATSRTWDAVVAHYFDSTLAARRYVDAGRGLGASAGVNGRSTWVHTHRRVLREPVR